MLWQLLTAERHEPEQLPSSKLPSTQLNLYGDLLLGVTVPLMLEGSLQSNL